MDTKEIDYRKLTTIQLKYELKQLERRILEITGDPLETGFRKFLTWANDKSAVEQVEEMMSTRSYLLNLLFERHCTPEEVSRLEKVNTLLKDLSDRTHKRTGNLAHLQSSVGAYPKSLHSLNMKNGRSETPLT